jgi:hypothetical protein
MTADAVSLATAAAHSSISPVSSFLPGELLRKLIVEDPVDPTQKIAVCNIQGGFLLDPLLDFALAADVGQALNLQMAPCGFSGVILPHGPFDLNGVGAVPLDQVRVVAVDHAKQFGYGLLRNRVQSPAEAEELSTSRLVVKRFLREQGSIAG